ncbi:hypothetical protein [Nocardia sp. NPDC049149]
MPTRRADAQSARRIAGGRAAAGNPGLGDVYDEIAPLDLAG